MIVNRALFMDGQFDYLDSMGYRPLIWAHLAKDSSRSQVVDDYIKGYEHRAAIADLVTERVKVDYSVREFHPLWGNHPPAGEEF